VTRRDERGTAIIELTWLALLLMLPLTYVVVTVFQVQRGAFAVAGAARAAARAYALADDDVAGVARARAAADQVLADHHVTASIGLTVACESPEPGNCHAAGAVVTVRIAGAVPLPLLPSYFHEHRSQIAVSSSHTVPMGHFREEPAP
jgi:Flp pilus assembly protein TadG